MSKDNKIRVKGTSHYIENTVHKDRIPTAPPSIVFESDKHPSRAKRKKQHLHEIEER